MSRQKITRKRPVSPDALDAAAEDVDDWMADIRTAFLARDRLHFDVLMARFEGRFRSFTIDALAVDLS